MRIQAVDLASFFFALVWSNFDEAAFRKAAIKNNCYLAHKEEIANKQSSLQQQPTNKNQTSFLVLLSLLKMVCIENISSAKQVVA